MNADLDSLLERAFHTADARDANRALAEARDRFPTSGGKAFSYELVVPESPDEGWITGTLLPRLVYHCESTRSPLPACEGVFVSLFQGRRLACVAAAEVVAWASGRLGLSPEEMVARWGTGEVRHALEADDPRATGAAAPAGLLPQGEDG